MNLTNFRDQIGGEFGLSLASGPDLTAIDSWVNQGIREVLRRTKCHQEHVAVDLTAGAFTGDWEITSPASPPIAILELYVPSDPPLFLKEQSAAEILRRRQTLANTEGPYFYHWAGEELLMFAPASSTKPNLRALLVPYPTELSAGSDDPSTDSKGGIPTEFHEVIYSWACWRASRWDGSSAPKSHKEYMDIFREQISDMRKHLRTRGSRRWSPAKIGYPGASLGRRNDVYPVR